MSKFTNEELNTLLASLQEQEIVLKTVLETIGLNPISKDKIFDVLINNITQQTIILKKQINHESNN